MADRITYRATEAGIKLVDERRIRRGWSRKSLAFADAANVGRATLGRFWMASKYLDKASIMGIFAAVGISDWEAYSEVRESEVKESVNPVNQVPIAQPEDENALGHVRANIWDNLPDYPLFFGRRKDLELLTRWVMQDQYRVINIWGLGGIGKSALAAKLAQQILPQFQDQFQDQFQGVIWRSMQSAPAMPEFLADLFSALTDEPISPGQHSISDLIAQLRRQRLLLIFDGWEALFGGVSAGAYQEAYKDYRVLLSHLGQFPHQSTILVTSRERSTDSTLLEAKVCFCQVRPLEDPDAFQLLNRKGLSFFDPKDGKRLVEIYSGNPLALQLVASRIRDHFNGNIAEFLRQNTVLVDESIRSILAQQTQNLSILEQQTLVALAQDPDPVDRDALRARFTEAPAVSDLVNALTSLERRSLVERTTELEAEMGANLGVNLGANLRQVLYGLQPMVRKYVRQNLWI